MRIIVRRQSPLLFRRSYKPSRILRIRPATKLHFVPRQPKAGFGSKPILVTAE